MEGGKVVSEAKLLSYLKWSSESQYLKCIQAFTHTYLTIYKREISFLAVVAQ